MSYDGLLKWLEEGDTVVSNVLLQNYKRVGLTDSEFVFILQIKAYIDKNTPFPNLSLIAEFMGVSEKEVFSLLHILLQKKVILMETKNDKSGKVEDTYSLQPLYQRLFQLLERDKQKAVPEKQAVDIMTMFEQEFGRNLSPIEMQTIASWMDTDHYPIDLIEAALREAVLNQAYSLKYIDRILLSWEKKNIRSAKDVLNQSKRTQGGNAKFDETNANAEYDMEVPLFNWLDSESNS